MLQPEWIERDRVMADKTLFWAKLARLNQRAK
jgi:hypothetical protein